MKKTYLFSILALSLTFGKTFSQSNAKKQPNIVFIYTDDQRYDALSVVQKEQAVKARFPWFKTPNLDRIANEGVRFRNAFVVNSLCSPSRSVLLTGKYNHLNGIANNHTNLKDTLETYPTQLRKNGYRTAFFGKWHMGQEKGKRPGFDYSASFIGQGQYFDCPLEVNGVSQPTVGWVDDVTTNFALDFIKGNKEKPFAVVLAFKSSHGPFQPAARNTNAYAGVELTKSASEQLEAPYKNQIEVKKKNPNAPQNLKKSTSWTENNDKMIRGYFGALKGVDENVGKILNLLDSLKLDKNTVVIFSSDNGYFLGEHGLGDKRAAYEEAMRIPLLVRYPARFPKGKTIDKLVLNLDQAPSILDLAGISAPKSYQGKSWVSLAENKPTDWRTSFLYEYFYEDNSTTPTIKAIRTETSKLIVYPGENEWSELYDLTKDPTESNNIVNKQGSAKLKEQLQQELAKQEKATGFVIPSYADERPLDKDGKYVRPQPVAPL
jgi:arylsulfatase A-like enzyme